MKESNGKGIVDAQEIYRISRYEKYPNMVYYLIDTTPGNSGSAVYYEDKEDKANQYKIVAIHTQGSSEGRKK